MVDSYNFKVLKDARARLKQAEEGLAFDSIRLLKTTLQEQVDEAFEELIADPPNAAMVLHPAVFLWAINEWGHHWEQRNAEAAQSEEAVQELEKLRSEVEELRAFRNRTLGMAKRSYALGVKHAP